MELSRTIFLFAKRGWLSFAHALGWFNTRLFLVLLYVVFIGFYAIVRRLFHILSSKQRDTSWIDYPPQSKTLEDFRHPF